MLDSLILRSFFQKKLVFIIFIFLYSQPSSAEYVTELVKVSDVEICSPMIEMNGEAYYCGRSDDGIDDIANLWKTDGTEEGTILVKKFTDAKPFYLYELTKVNDTLFFGISDPDLGYGLWKSDGTEAGTVLVKDIKPGARHVNESAPRSLINVDGTLFFVSNDVIHGQELWKSDGTEVGTNIVKDIRVGSQHSSPTSLGQLNGSLYFRATEDDHGYELWKSDGTEAGTILVKDIFPGEESSTPTIIIKFNEFLFFTAEDPLHKRELWKTDGTEAGTTLVKDLLTKNNNTENSNISNFKEYNGSLYFSANDGNYGDELWKTDGTEAGTVLVKDINNFFKYSSSPRQFTNFNGRLFFSAHTTQYGTELWSTDGTEAGTVLFKDIHSDSSFPRSLINIDGTLFFAAHDDEHGQEIWMSDGTEEGTKIVKDIKAGSYPSSPRNNTNIDGTLYFTTFTYPYGTSLWKIQNVDKTVYEDAEDGTIGDWVVFDKNPVGASISNVFDNEKDSLVISLQGRSTKNGYRLGNHAGNEGAFNNTIQNNIKLDLNFNENFVFNVIVNTSLGQRFLVYRPVNDNVGIRGSSGQYIHIGVGTNLKDGQWHTLERDLQADLTLFEADNQILSVDGFKVRGSGLLDNISLLERQFNTMIEDAEDKTTNGWIISDKGPAGATVTNIYSDIFESGIASNVISLQGDGIKNSFRLGNHSGRVGSWNNTSQKRLRWDMKFEELFIVTVTIETTLGRRYLVYRPINQNNGIKGAKSNYINHGLGVDRKNGVWQHVSRDLQTDLHTFESGNKIISINGFEVKGSGQLDNIELH